MIQSKRVSLFSFTGQLCVKCYLQIMIGRVVETKAKFYAEAAASTEDIRQMSPEVGTSFQVSVHATTKNHLRRFALVLQRRSTSAGVSNILEKAKTGTLDRRDEKQHADVVLDNNRNEDVRTR